MMDLARQAANEIGEWVSSDHYYDPANASVAMEIICRHGVLVSHEDAELLREMWPQLERLRRAAKHSTVLLRLETRCEDKDQWRREFTAALKSALDAAGVPDEKGAERWTQIDCGR